MYVLLLIPQNKNETFQRWHMGHNPAVHPGPCQVVTRVAFSSGKVWGTDEDNHLTIKGPFQGLDGCFPK